MNTTTDQIKALLAASTQRAESATKGQWLCDEQNLGTNEQFPKTAVTINCGIKAIADLCGRKESLDAEEWASTQATGRFIAAARTDLPARDRALMIAVEALTEMALPWQNGWRGANEPNAIGANEALAAMLTALQGETACMHCGRPAGEHCGNFPGTPEGACKSDAGDVEHPWRDTKFTAMQGEGGAR